jgi:nucleoside-diphosphate-sugar epimerase
MHISFMHPESRIYIAGHRGLVGSAIHRELQRQGYRNIVIRTHQELDLLDKVAVDTFFNTAQTGLRLSRRGQGGWHPCQQHLPC